MFSNPFQTISMHNTHKSWLPVDGQSYIKGKTDPPLIHLTVGGLLQQAAVRYPKQLACVFSAEGVRWNWSDFYQKTLDLAESFLTLGLRPGDRVGIWAPNRSEWLLTLFATSQIGLILVNINPAYRLSELEYALNKVEVKALVLADKFKSSDYLEMVQTLAPELERVDNPLQPLNASRLPHLAWLIQMSTHKVKGMLRFHELTDLRSTIWRSAIAELAAKCKPQDAVNIQFTSGTTGQPKGATLSHFNIVNNACSTAQVMALTSKDKLCIPVPMYHCFGMVLGVLACVYSGACMVFPSEGFEATSTLSAVAQEQCTALHGVPTMFIAELEHPEFEKFQLSSLRTGIMAGAPCPIEVMKQVMEKMNMREVTIAYGMTETSPVSFQTAIDDPIEQRVASVGRVFPHLEVKVVDVEGNVVPVGEKGELCTKGYAVMLGYWNDATRTAEAVVDGWMHTGDLAVIDEQGYCSIVGRVKDMIIRGGENVYPREVEEFYFRHPKIAQAQVFGIPDKKFGEEV
ncbi:MAG: AMP-binding protein, partial [Gammaproteobacteria bacterium]|nr:AMP-binding protein [Gammaproteobacteria bacterium]